MNRSWEIVIAIVIALTASHSALGAVSGDQNSEKFHKNFTLDIFGNANMDENIDEKDITYLEGVIKGTNAATNLSDANYDGRIDAEDIDQIELIIKGEEKNLTFIDIFGDAETVKHPLNHVANIGLVGIQLMLLIGAEENLLPVVGSDRSKESVFWGDISKWHVAGATPPNVDFEYLLTLKPDAVQTNLEMLDYVNDDGRKQKKEFHEKLPGIPLICLNAREPDKISQSIMILGYIFDKKQEAKNFVDWHETNMNKIKEIAEHIPAEKKKKALINTHKVGYTYAAGGSRFGQTVTLAGGRNLMDDIIKSDDPLYGQGIIDVEPEWVIKENPEYIFTSYLDANYKAGFETDDTSGVALSVQGIMNTTELSMVDAIKNGNVYYINNLLMRGGGMNLIGAALLGKLMYPEEYKEINPTELLREYMAFFDKDHNIQEGRGVFLYPPAAS